MIYSIEGEEILMNLKNPKNFTKFIIKINHTLNASSLWGTQYINTELMTKKLEMTSLDNI